MAATNRLFVDFVSGVTSAALSSGGTTISGAFLANLPKVADPDFIALVLDPESVGGNPEIVWVTAHAAGATTATIQRGREGTSARSHASGIKVVASLTSDALERITLPVGGIMFWPTATPPSGWLYCDGSLVSRTTYAKLFSVIGTRFGAGDGSTTFALPDLRGRAIFGLGSSPLNAIGNKGGTFNHTHNVPTHNHSMSHTHDMTHTHTVNPPGTSTSENGSHQHSIPNTGSAGSHSHILEYDGSVGTHGHSGTSSGRHHFRDNYEDIRANGAHTHSVPNTNRAGTHSHGVDIPAFTSGGSSRSNTGGPSNSNTGGSGTLQTTSSNPPYFVLMPIIRAF